MPNDEALVTVATFTTLGEAVAARLMLESRGISCFLADAETVSMTWLVSNAVGGVKLQVPEPDAIRAGKLLVKRIVHRDTDDYGLERQTARPAVEHSTADRKPNRLATHSGEADRAVDRAFRAAMFGLFFCPPLLHLYSLGMILQLPWISDSVSPHKRPRLWATALLDVTMIVLGPILVRFLISGLAWFLFPEG
jgi:hypothetical protein